MNAANRFVPGFDAGWYLRVYPDVAAAGMDPLEHYLSSGCDEGRLPGPTWDDTDDSDDSDDSDDIVEPTVRTDTASLDKAIANMQIEIQGGRMPSEGARVLVVGHAAGEEVFGAERNLIELLDGFATIGFHIVVTLPTEDNKSYIEEVRARCHALHIAPVPMRRPLEPPNELLVDQWCRLIERHSIQAVHVNTIIPREPLVAARSRGIAAVVHAHEVPLGDSGLCAQMGASADEIAASVTADATYVIGNSAFTANFYDKPGCTAVVPNIVDLEKFKTLTTSRPRPAVALIGGATLKKGVRDFARLATNLRDRVDAEFIIVGPRAAATSALRGCELPDNLTLSDYTQTSAEAIAKADIVVSISRCRESFARTALEGMAAGLPIVAYNRGALPLLVDQGRTGQLVAFDDAEGLADAVERLCRDPELRHQMGAAGRAKVAEAYTPAHLGRALDSAYKAILKSAEVVRQQARDIIVQLDWQNRTQFLEPFFAGYRSRWAYAVGVVFLDDTTLAAVSLLGCRIHTIKFDPDQREARVVAELPTTHFADLVPSEVIDTDGRGRVVTSNGERSSVSLYEYDGECLHWARTLEFSKPEPAFCHSARFLPWRDDIVVVSILTETRGVRFLSTADGSLLCHFQFDGRAAKDVAFKGTDRMAVALHNELIMPSPIDRIAGAIALMTFDLDGGEYKILDEYDTGDAILDSVYFHNDRLYATCQQHDVVMVFDTANDRLQRLADMEGFPFPHQVAISPDSRWMAVACYGDNSVVLRPLMQ
ncbi:MAG: glycosyltransferase family 4 protein [Actinomycetia bacterium]|nr:glycosyltransferase family 4 protein [Actinomycetes bacterium]